MSAITIDGGLVHYEVLGRGRPVVFVHGWLGSWRYWVPTMQQLSVKYRTYALDLWGFGDSSKEVTRYGLKDQMALVAGFFERLGIPKAALIGHSFGAAVCLAFARQYPEKAHRMMLISPPLFDVGGLGDELPGPPPARAEPPSVPSAAPVQTWSHNTETIPRNPLRTRPDESPDEILQRLRARNTSATTGAAAETQVAGSVPPRPATPVLPTTIATPILPAQPAPTLSDPQTQMRTSALNPLVGLLTGLKPSALLLKYVDRDNPILETLRAEVEKSDEQALVKSAQSFNGVNLALELKRLTTPTLLLHGEDDPFLTSPPEDLLRRINTGKPAGHFLPLIEPALRHFPMLEMAARFNRLLIEFLETPDLTNVQFKDQWRRTLR